MKPASRLQQFAEPLSGWSSFHTEWKVHFNSFALCTKAGVVLIDPVKPQPAVLKKIAALGEPGGIILTNANHSRDADWFRKEFEIQVYAHEKASADCEIKIDVPVMDGENLPGGLRVIYLPGSGAGEIGLHTKAGGGILFLGDALLHLPGEGLSFLPEQYCEDSKEAHRSIRKLQPLDFKIVTFAHGTPLTVGAKQQITQFLKQPRKKDS
jgi:glyoxylase-like metal-dependent hydrolase (beta-lactamase superfamily II)